MKARWQELVSIVSGILGELTDQNAYARHLKAHNASHSPEEWRRFCDEHWGAQAKRAKCC